MGTDIRTQWERQQEVAQLFGEVETLAMKAARSLTRDKELPAPALLEQLKNSYEESMKRYQQLVADYPAPS